MKLKKERIVKNELGITLIALVITIIVLLILAGVSIAMLTGENGILTQAQNAKEETTKAEEEEKIQLAISGNSIIDNGYADVLDETSLKQELANQFGNEAIDIEPIKDGSFIVTVKGTQRKYYINDDKTVINSDNVIEIGTLDELMAFRDDVNNGNTYEGKVVLLTGDITIDQDWNPIGKYDSSSTNPDDTINKSFKGIFDGKFHKIKELNIESTEKAKGLFALVKGGTIKNIGIESGNINTTSSTVGGIVGYAYDNAKISNCYNKASITITDRYAGGIVGYTKNNVVIENCYNAGIITTELSQIGGICGVLSNSKISNCYNVGSVIGTATKANFLGGICSGIVDKCIIENSYNVGDITSVNEPNSNYTKAIVGFTDSAREKSVINNNYFLENSVNGGNGVFIEKGTQSKTDNEMKEIYNLLGDKFQKDDENNLINNGYPILFWQ